MAELKSVSYWDTSDSEYPFYPILAPTRVGDAGIDLRSTEHVTLPPGAIKVVPTGLHIKMPSDLTALVCPRSGMATKGITIVNSPGIVDSNYVGEIKAILANLGSADYVIDVGDRIAQLLFQVVPEVSTYYNATLERAYAAGEDMTVRGSQGFGSSGK